MTRRRTQRRSRRDAQFVKLDHGLLDTEAWGHLSPHAFKLLVAIWRRHNGHNNGEIPYSRREAMQLLGCGSHRASAAFRELTDKGFLKLTRASSFDLKTKEAREWALTAERLGDDPPMRDFKHWQPQKQNTGAERAPHGCRESTRAQQYFKELCLTGVERAPVPTNFTQPRVPREHHYIHLPWHMPQNDGGGEAAYASTGGVADSPIARPLAGESVHEKARRVVSGEIARVLSLVESRVEIASGILHRHPALGGAEAAAVSLAGLPDVPILNWQNAPGLPLYRLEAAGMALRLGAPMLDTGEPILGGRRDSRCAS